MAYDPTLPDEELSVMCAHGAAHCVLDRDGDPQNHADAWVLTALLLVPRAAVQTLSERDLVARSRCPAWLTRAVRDLLTRWDSSGDPVSCKQYSESA